MRNRNGFTVLATVFIMLVLGLTAMFVGSLYRQDALFAVRNFHSLRAFFVAEAMLSRLTKILESDSDWSDNGPFSVSFAGGTAWGNYMTAEVQTAKVWLVATYEGETRKIVATISKEAGSGLPEAFNYAVFWENSAGTSAQLDVRNSTSVVGDVVAKGNVRVRNGCSVTGGTIYVPPGYSVQVDAGATVSSWEVRSDLPSFPSIDYSYYDNLISSYEALLPAGGPDYSFGSGSYTLTGEVVTCNSLDLYGTFLIRGHGVVAANTNITLRGNVVVSPEGGSIVFVARRNIFVRENATIKNTTAEADFATVFLSVQMPLWLYNDNLEIYNTLAMSRNGIYINNNPYVGDNSVFYVPASNDYIFIWGRPSIEGSVISRGRLYIYGGEFTGLVYCSSSWGTLLNLLPGAAYFHGALVSDRFRFDRIMNAAMAWDPTYLPPLPPGMSSGSPEVVTTSWEEVDYWVTW